MQGICWRVSRLFAVIVHLMRLLLPFLAFSAALAKSPYPEKTPDTPGNKLLDRYLAGEARQWRIERSGVGRVR